MKFLTGDDTGILKVVKVEAQKVERLGPQRPGDAAERLCWAGPEEDRESRVAVAYASGLLESRDTATGKVLASAKASPSVRCLQVLGSGLLSISADGCAGIVREWCGDACPEGGEEGAKTPAYAGALDPASVGGAEGAEGAEGDGGPWLRRFALPGPIADACIDPCRAERLAFGGGENDVKVFDMEKGEVSWRAKNVRENSLCLRVPVNVNCLSWATRLAPSRSLLLSASSDGKVRLYDVAAQRRPLFELFTYQGSAQGSAGHTGAADDTARPLNCSAVAQVAVRGGDNGWSFFVGDTVGTLREYDLRYLPACKAAPIPPGRKKHLAWAGRQLPFRRGYRGIMGSIRAVDIHASGEAVVSVGLGRFAHLFETKKRSKASLVSKVYLKQKLCSVLFSSEEKVASKDDGLDLSDVETDATGGLDDDDLADGPANDEVQEGFSDDGEEGGDEAAENAASAKKPKRKKRRRSMTTTAEAAQATGEQEATSAPDAGTRKKKKPRATRK